MTIEEMRKRKQEKGYSYEQISELSGVPLGTIQKIFCGETQNPRYDAPEERAVMGAPDFVLEVISPSTTKKDCIKKLAKYENAGVREYWILDPYQQTLLVYFFESEVYPVIYGISGKVPVGISQGELQIDLSRISEWVKAAV